MPCNAAFAHPCDSPAMTMLQLRSPLFRRTVWSRPPKGRAAVLALAMAFFGFVVPLVAPTPAQAQTGANFIATGHDMDHHCQEDSKECAYLKILVDKVRNGSTLPILALDEGTLISSSLAKSGITQVETVSPVTPAFTTKAFTGASGNPLYSAIITADRKSVV